MLKILIFCKNHYQFILFLFVALFNFLVFLLKKKPSSDLKNDVKLAIVEKLPQLIVQAELAYDSVLKSGTAKKDLVVSLALEVVSGFYHRSLTCDEVSYFKNFISSSIESMLSTPTKKEE